MVRVCLAPLLDDVQAPNERLAGRVVVCVSDVQDFDPRGEEIGVWSCGEVRELADEGRGVVASLRVGKDVELKIADGLVVELNIEGRVGVVVVLDVGKHRRLSGMLLKWRFAMVRVVRADDLDLVHADAARPGEAIVGIGLITA